MNDAGIRRRADTVVVFGASGDLARSKLLPALAGLERRDRLGVPIIGVGRTPWDDDDFRRHLTQLLDHGDRPAGALEGMVRRAGFVSGDYRSHELYARLASRLSGSGLPLVYLAIPPDVFPDVVAGLSRAGLASRARLLVEKPFGRDRASAHRLNKLLQDAVPEDAVFRVDHFLGKAAVQNLLVFRLSNPVFEPAWDHRSIERVTIEMTETDLIRSRGSFYDGVGATRDMVQNHLMEVLALLAMEPPATAAPDAWRAEKLRVLRATHAVGPPLRGQYDGYRCERGVDPASDTETFVAARFAVDTPRWSGVPFDIRAGKALDRTETVATVTFRETGHVQFPSGRCGASRRNTLRFRMKPDDHITLTVQTRGTEQEPSTCPVDLTVSAERELGAVPEAYEVLLDDALAGRPARFAGAADVEEAWRVVEPLLADPPPVVPYEPGSPGPGWPAATGTAWPLAS